MIATRTLSILILLELLFVPLFASAGPADPVLMGIQLSQINYDVINGLLIDKCNVSYPSTVPALKDAIDKWKSKNTDALNELHQITKDNLIKIAHLSESDATAKIAQTSELMTNGLKAQFENISGVQLKEACNGKYAATTLQTLDFPSVLALMHSANAEPSRTSSLPTKENEPVMVRIPGKNYEMGKFDVTQGEWKDVMGNNPSKFSKCGDNCPVEQVSWDNIQNFLQKLNAKTGRQYRLPTQAEWEYACYGGKQTEYCGSNDIEAVAWYEGNSGGQTHPVGQKQANGYGLYDMSGNVWQWMQDWNAMNPSARALCGGSFLFKPTLESATFRGGREPNISADFIGFRLARTLP